MKSSVITAFLTHQGPREVRRMLDYWAEHQPGLNAVVAYGGSRQHFDELVSAGVDALYIDDPRLRTQDHPRERQSYLGVFKALIDSVANSGAETIHFVEYDEVPVVDDVQSVLLERLEAERADLLACGLKRVDGTNHPHLLAHDDDPAFAEYWAAISCREDPSVVLSALGCGTFWRAEAFAKVASLDESLRIYLELFLPTAAHHLGFRVRPLGGQYEFMQPANRFAPRDLPGLAAAGALCAHPVKAMWLADPR